MFRGHIYEGDELQRLLLSNIEPLRPLKIEVVRIVFQPGRIIFSYEHKLESPNELQSASTLDWIRLNYVDRFTFWKCRSDMHIKKYGAKTSWAVTC